MVLRRGVGADITEIAPPGTPSMIQAGAPIRIAGIHLAPQIVVTHAGDRGQACWQRLARPEFVAKRRTAAVIPLVIPDVSVRRGDGRQRQALTPPDRQA